MIQASIQEAIARRDAGGRAATFRAVAAGRRERRPVVLKGIVSSKYCTIPAARLADLRIDESYQRLRVEALVQDLAFVLRHGGRIPHPVTLVRRSNGHTYIVDGQQRFWAHLEAEADLPAMVHEVDSFETEKQMFIALNTTSRVSPAVMVRSWPGPSAGLLLRAAEDRDHPLCGRVNFGVGGFHSGRTVTGLLGAVALVGGMVAAASGTHQGGNVVRLLQTLDAKIAAGAARARAEAFLRLVPEAFPAGRADAVKLRCLGSVAHQRWGDSPALPPARIVAALARIDWEDLVPGREWKYAPVILEAIRRRWPERWR